MYNSELLSYKFNTLGHNNRTDESTLKHAQKVLKGIPNSELPLKMLNSVVKSMMEHQYVIDTLCSDIEKWVVTSKQCNEVSIILYEKIVQFIENVKTLGDYRKCFIFKDEQINIWVIVEEADYETSIKYIALAREILNTQYLKINLMIYSYDELDEVIEELKGSGYKYIEE